MERRVLESSARAEERNLILGGAFPHFPLLPITRDSDLQPDHGVLVWRYVPPGQEKTAGPWTVHLVNLFDLPEVAARIKEETGEEKVTIGAVLEGAETLTYDTLDEFFDDGWRGD